MVQLDNFTIPQRQQYILSTAVIGVVLSTLSMALRIWARMTVLKRLKREDWLMLSALLLSYATAILNLFALHNGLGKPIMTLSRPEAKNFLLSVWIIQKFQPPTLFLIKVSMLVFNASIFQSRGFRRLSWALGIFTLLWMIGNVLGTTLQCNPPSFFYDKAQQGTCASHTVLTIGLTSAVISCIGDIIIYLMPIPLLLKLKVDKKTRLGLIGVFLLGLVVVLASFFRWIALISGNTGRGGVDSSAYQIAVWTYLEMSIAITCGNLPFLAPLLGCIGPRRKTKASGYYLRRGPKRDGNIGGSKEVPSSHGSGGIKQKLEESLKSTTSTIGALKDVGSSHREIGRQRRDSEDPLHPADSGVSSPTIPKDKDASMRMYDVYDSPDSSQVELRTMKSRDEDGWSGLSPPNQQAAVARRAVSPAFIHVGNVPQAPGRVATRAGANRAGDYGAYDEEMGVAR